MMVRNGPALACRGAAAAGVLIVIASLTAWLATGREGYTRWPDAKLASVTSPSSPGETDLLEEIGFSTAEEETAVPTINSRFAFGLVPGGADPKHLISLSSGSALGVAMVLGSVLVSRRGSRLVHDQRQEDLA